MSLSRFDIPNMQVLPGGGGGPAGDTYEDQYAAAFGLKLATMPGPQSPVIALTLGAGILPMVMVRSVVAQTITSMGVQIVRAGVTASGYNGIGCFTAAGVLLGQTVDMSASFAVLGWAAGALTAPVNLAAQTSYYFAPLSNFSGTTPQITGVLYGGAIVAAPINGAYPSVFDTGHATFPASVTPSALTINSGYYYIGAL